MPPIIKIENLGKRYTLRHLANGRGPYRRLSEELADAIKRPFRALAARTAPAPAAASHHAASEQFWALRDVSFNVEEGEVIGIVGRNGAGKSTLLKILSRITEPTTGRITIRGRVASLLEVGTGFHPELTGRENIFLNGAILGMTRREIKRKFDEIVSFAEVEKFLDMPVKRYSSGMYVRLAFAVAAHLESEILFVDEVLAVGDAEFQKKSLGKMSAAARGGRTVFFVSHNMNAVQALCTKVAWMESGALRQLDKDVHAVTTKYLFGNTEETRQAEWLNDGSKYEKPKFKALRFAICDESGNAVSSPITNNQPVWVRIEGQIEQLDPGLILGYALYSESGQILYNSLQTDVAESNWPRLKSGRCRLKSRLPARLLNEGTYRLELIGGLYGREWLYQPSTDVPSLTIAIQGGLSDSPHWMAPRPGILAPVLCWECEGQDADGAASPEQHARNGETERFSGISGNAAEACDGARRPGLCR